MLLVAVAAFVCSTAFGAEPVSITGRATVIDGDTIAINGIRIRLNGIDAPEARQLCRDETGAQYRCGTESANALGEQLSLSRPTRCRFVEWDQYGRFVGNCFRSDGSDVAKWLVRNGHAVDWPKYSMGRYAIDQAFARENRYGLWRGPFALPWNWRATMQSAGSEPHASSDLREDCRIKGNVSHRSGRKIYHKPGQLDYEKTQIDEQRGERWFCSEDDARAAGWSPAQR